MRYDTRSNINEEDQRFVLVSVLPQDKYKKIASEIIARAHPELGALASTQSAVHADADILSVLLKYADSPSPDILEGNPSLAFGVPDIKKRYSGQRDPLSQANSALKTMFDQMVENLVNKTQYEMLQNPGMYLDRVLGCGGEECRQEQLVREVMEEVYSRTPADEGRLRRLTENFGRPNLGGIPPNQESSGGAPYLPDSSSLRATSQFSHTLGSMGRRGTTRAAERRIKDNLEEF